MVGWLDVCMILSGWWWKVQTLDWTWDLRAVKNWGFYMTFFFRGGLVVNEVVTPKDSVIYA